ncbi:mitochondrial fission 1 protein [Meira miltonrushii]|uniref:Mitochondrial fission 1 protein n=1 Tax=Meira miltonrushii TaxID=1280837 RepID=A0A316V9Y4_9BASI|nr:mitochondrial fission 1 protein [Meira miltonrushii]PWN32305.1 mitochondrial fission 1 protein [Meira miltonrushii]
MSLPYAVDAEQPLQPAELAVLRDQYLNELNQGHASTQTKFNYAWGLVKSRKREDMAEGVALLTEIYRSDPPRRRECLYYLSLGHYKMGNYEEAKRFNALLMEREPHNQQAQSLNQLIEKGVAREGYIGMALMGGAAAVGGVILAGLMRRGRR